MVEQFSRDARVLAGDQIGGGQHFQRAQRDVAQVSDRRRHQIEPGGKPRRLDRLPGKRVTPHPCGFIVRHAGHSSGAEVFRRVPPNHLT